MITPSVINFNYKKFDTLPPAVLISFPESEEPLSFIIPAWITVYDIGLSSAKVRLNLGVNELNGGYFSESCTLKAYLSDPDKYISLGTFTVNLNLEDTILLNVDPVVANFNFNIGGTTPPDKVITVTSENDWTVAKTQGWLNLSAVAGTGTGTFAIGVITTGLAAGTYYDVVTVNDGVAENTIAVSLVVSDENSGTDFLYVNPTLLTFGFTTNGSLPPQKTIELNTSASWTASADQSWVNVTVASGTAGVSLVPIALQTISGLAAGDHFANITFTMGTIIKTVVVKLTVYDFVTDLLEEGKLYFTDDDNMLNVVSGRNDTFMKLDFTTLYKSSNYYLTAEIPFFQGVSSKRIGERPKVIIGKQSFLNYAEASLFVPYPVVSLNIGITELELFTKATVQTQNLNNIKFIKGRKPLDNWISAQAKKVFLTKDAVLYFSVLTNGVAASSIEITGAQTKTYSFTPITADFLTAVVPLADIGFFNEGDAITVSVLGNTIEVVIKADATEQTQVFFENEWGVWDCVEFTGDVTITDEFQRKTVVTRKSELYTETKIIDVTKPLSIAVSTGEVHTDANVDTVSKLLQSRNVYLYTNNQVFQVNPTTSKLPLYNTTRKLRSFDLTFKNVIE